MPYESGKRGARTKIMRRRLAQATMWLVATTMVAGCGSLTPERERNCLIGAGVGALVGGGRLVQIPGGPLPVLNLVKLG